MILRSILQAVAAFEEKITRLFLAFIVVLVFIAAFTRFLGFPINWSVDIAQAVFVWVIYLGADQAWRKSRHIGIDLLFKKFNRRVQFYLELAVYAAIIVFLVSIIVSGIVITIVNAGRILNDIPISYSFVTIAVPLGSFLMLVTTLGKIFRLVAENKTAAQN